jgi:shikimate dehydrogenase
LSCARKSSEQRRREGEHSSGAAAAFAPAGRAHLQALQVLVCVEAGGKAEIELVDWNGDYAVAASVDVVVNATSIGLAPDMEARLALDVSSLQPHMVVADVIPNPPQTRLLKDAAARGCRTLDGLGMLVNQGATNMEYWTGVAPDKTVMRKVLEEIFGV